MKQRKFSLIPVLGICLILASFLLMIGFQIRMELGTRKCEAIVTEMESLLPDRTAGVTGLDLYAGMPVLEIDGVDYAALLEIPVFDIALPVANRWDSGKLSNAPARFAGSAYENTLVIGGADHRGQFAFCSRIDHGVLVTVTDMTGAQFTYTVVRVDRADHAESQWLMAEDYDLTLFCHDSDSGNYIAVRCASGFQK